MQAAAARRFVGRERELALVRRAMAGETPTWPVLLLHGPGGVGKTTLLERLCGIAAESGVDSLRLDGRDIDPSPDGFLRALGGALGLPDDACELDRVCDRLGERGRLLFVLDTFEQLQPLEAWLRDSFLPACPQGMLTVLAGRLAPQREWMTHPLWHGHAYEVALGNLSRDDCHAYLRATGVRAALHEQVIALSHGHPLALSLLADIARSNDGVPASLAADVIRDLAARFTATAPSRMHRRALEVCAMLRRTTEEALAHARAGAPSEPD